MEVTKERLDRSKCFLLVGWRLRLRRAIYFLLVLGVGLPLPPLLPGSILFLFCVKGKKEKKPRSSLFIFVLQLLFVPFNFSEFTQAKSATRPLSEEDTTQDMPKKM